MKFVWGFMIATVMLGSATGANASTGNQGKPVNLIVNNAGRLFFDFTGTRDQPPACSVYNRWVIDATTDQGRAMMSLLLTAKAQDKTITVYGTWDCRDWSDTEAVDHILVHG